VSDEVLAEYEVLVGAAKLLDGVTSKGAPAPVKISRIYPYRPQDLPALCVYWPDTDYTQAHGTPGRRIERAEQRVQVAAVFARPQGVENTLEGDMAEVLLQVRNRLADGYALENPNRQPLVSKLALQKFQSGFVGDASVSVVVAVLTYGMTIHTRECEAGKALAVRQ
jgi:hypothetical protein